MAQPTLDESELTFLTTLNKTQSLPITVNQRSFRVAHRAVKPTKNGCSRDSLETAVFTAS